MSTPAAIMEFSPILQQKLCLFARKSLKLDDLSEAILKLLISEGHVDCDATYEEVMRNPLLQDTLMKYLALALSDDSASSEFGLSQFNIFINGKNDTGLHNLINEANMTMNSTQFQKLVLYRNALNKSMRRTRKRLIEGMNLSEAPSAATASLKSKEDISNELATNADTARSDAASKRTMEQQGEETQEEEAQCDEEQGELTDLTSEGGEKKKAKHTPLKSTLLTYFPDLKTGIFFMLNDEGDLLYSDSPPVPDILKMY